MPRARRYHVNESIFDDAANNPEAAYWIGFLMADGHVCAGKRYVVRLALSVCDKYHVESFKAFLRSEHPIKVVHYENSGYDTSGPMAQIDVCSKRLVLSLVSYGVVPGKKRRAEVIGLENNRHFWRGCVDGDGSLGFQPTTASMMPRIRLCGSRPIVEQFHRFVLSVAPTCTACPHPSKSIWEMNTTGRYAQRVITALYGDCSIALPRKLELAQKALAWQWKPGAIDLATIPQDQIDVLYKELGSWKAVAAHLSIHTATLGNFLRSRRIRAGTYVRQKHIRLSDEAVAEIRDDFQSGRLTMRQLAEKHGVANSTIRRMVRNLTRTSL